MYRLLLLSFLALCIKAYNVDYYSDLQMGVEMLTQNVMKLGKEINTYFQELCGSGCVPGDIVVWYERNKANLDDEARLFKELQDNVTSTKDILNYTQVFLDGTEETHRSLQREERRARVIEDQLARQAIHAGNSSSEMNAVRDRLAHALSQQASADERMNEAQVRLLGMRSKLDDLIKREGKIEFRLNQLHDTLIEQKARADTVFLGEKQVKENLEKLKRRTKEMEEAINQAQHELQTLTTRSGEPSAEISAVPSMNYIKSEKTAYGKGKRIKLVLLSD